MISTKKFLFLSALTLLGIHHAISAQAADAPNNTVVIIPAYGEVKQINDQAYLTFAVEEQDKNKATAASRVNQKMKEGTDALKKLDPHASLQTRGYYTYPVYPEDTPNNRGAKRQPISWRVGQYLDMTTATLNSLSQTVAAVQNTLNLERLTFGLKDSTRKKLDSASIESAYAHLTERIATISRALGRSPSDSFIESIDLEGNNSGNFDGGIRMMSAVSAAPMMKNDSGIAEPSFEPGETNVHLRLIGKIRIK